MSSHSKQVLHPEAFSKPTNVKEACLVEVTLLLLSAPLWFHVIIGHMTNWLNLEKRTRGGANVGAVVLTPLLFRATLDSHRISAMESSNKDPTRSRMR